MAPEDGAKDAAKLVEFLAKAIVTEPDEIKVVVVEDGRVLELETASEDRGRVIGRQGRVAKAMRAVVAASAVGGDCRLEIVD
jgi:predicted RNA-binding protein YlqC (UPF0109 family)